MAKRFFIETLGCPKNQVDSDKLMGTLLADGMVATDDALMLFSDPTEAMEHLRS